MGERPSEEIFWTHLSWPGSGRWATGASSRQAVGMTKTPHIWLVGTSKQGMDNDEDSQCLQGDHGGRAPGWYSVNRSWLFLAVQIASMCASSTQKPVCIAASQVAATPLFEADVFKH